MNRRLLVLLVVSVFSGVFWIGACLDGRAVAEDKRPVVQTSLTKAEVKPEAEAATDEDAFPAGTVKISPARQQLIGVRTTEVQKAPQQYVIRALGRVASDETRIYRINAALDGWTWKTFDTGTGSLVKKDQVLASYYSPEFLSAEQAYIFAVSSLSRFSDNGRENPQQTNLTEKNIKQYKDTLLNLGMSDAQIEELGQTQKYTENVKITSPVEGLLLSRKVSPGERFVKGSELYSIVDLRRVWILADLFEKDPHDLTPGTQVRVTVPYQKKSFEATVSDALPIFDGPSRTFKMRLEADNPEYLLRPGMFVDIEIPVKVEPTITVPSDAVLGAGLRKTVYVARGNGFFEPREVETGREIGDRVEITSGLEPGERIALSGTFLIDSESRMEMAASGVYENLRRDPVNGLDVSVNKAEKAGRFSKYKGKTYYFVSEETKTQFEQEPEKHLQPK